MQPVPDNHPITTNILLNALDTMQMPSLLKRGLLGLTQNKVGRHRADDDVDDLAHLVHAPTTILVRFMAAVPELLMPLTFPSPREFLQMLTAALPEPPELRMVSIHLGLEQSAASRWHREENKRPYTAVQVLMALITVDPDRIVQRWQTVMGLAVKEAALRGIDLDTAGGWGKRRQRWIRRANKPTISEPEYEPHLH